MIGANAYTGHELDNAVGDAVRVAEALLARGFMVSTVLDSDLATVDAALAAFRSAAQNAELALIYLAGHAVERHGSGYFPPVDFSFPPTAAGLRCTAGSLNAFIEATNGAASRIVVLDGCRNWPHDPDEATRTSNDLDELVTNERDWPLRPALSRIRHLMDGVAGRLFPALS